MGSIPNLNTTLRITPVIGQAGGGPLAQRTRRMRAVALTLLSISLAGCLPIGIRGSSLPNYSGFAAQANVATVDIGGAGLAGAAPFIVSRRASTAAPYA